MGGFVPIFGPSLWAGLLCKPHGEPMSERSLLMLPLANFMPPIPGMTALAGSLKTYAASPVWRDSTTDDVKFHPMPKKQAVRLYHRARDFERRTREPGKQDGALGRNGLAVLHAMIFDFLNFRTGQLDPGYEAIARKACIGIRSAARGLQNLKRCGILNWLRRCTAIFKDGRCILDQDTNAYAILPSSQWLGYVEPPEAPAPQPGTWGDHPCGMRAPMEEAVIEQRGGGGMQAVIRQLELDEPGSVAARLASLGRAMLAKKT
jgi:hypothetical protein